MMKSLLLAALVASVYAWPNPIPQLRVCALKSHEFNWPKEPLENCTGYDLAGNLCRGFIYTGISECCDVAGLCSPGHGDCQPGVPMGVCPKSEIAIPAAPKQ